MGPRLMGWPDGYTIPDLIYSPKAGPMSERYEPIMLRASEVAALMSISRSEVYRLIERGEIPVVRFGRSVRVPRQWVEQQAGMA